MKKLWLPTDSPLFTDLPCPFTLKLFLRCKSLTCFTFWSYFQNPRSRTMLIKNSERAQKHLLLNEHDFKISKFNFSVNSDSPFKFLLIHLYITDRMYAPKVPGIPTQRSSERVVQSPNPRPRGLILFRSLNGLIWLFGTLYNLFRCELRRVLREFYAHLNISFWNTLYMIQCSIF